MFDQQNIFKKRNNHIETFVCAWYVVTAINVNEGRHIADPKFVKHHLLAVAEENKQFKASEFAKICTRCIQEL